METNTTREDALILKDVAPCAIADLSATLPVECSKTRLGKERLIRAEPYESMSSIRVYPGAMPGVHLRFTTGVYSGMIEFTPPADGEDMLYLGTPNIPTTIDAATPRCALYLSEEVATRIHRTNAELCSNHFPGV